VRRRSNERNCPDVEPDDAHPDTHSDTYSHAYAYAYSYSNAATTRTRIESRPYTGACAKPRAGQHSGIIRR
jgi:hypothetical protein